MGCDLDDTYFDVPRMRTATHGGYLTAGIAYAFHPHRDTWYSAPFSQINWWIPMYEIEPDNSMAFHLRYWNAEGCSSGTSGCQPARRTATSDGGVITSACPRRRRGRGAS